MAGFDENIVREYFELNGFFVRQLRKYAVQSRKKRADEEIDLIVFNPNAPVESPETGFNCFPVTWFRFVRQWSWSKLGTRPGSLPRC